MIFLHVSLSKRYKSSFASKGTTDWYTGPDLLLEFQATTEKLTYIHWCYARKAEFHCCLDSERVTLYFGIEERL